MEAPKDETPEEEVQKSEVPKEGTQKKEDLKTQVPKKEDSKSESPKVEVRKNEVPKKEGLKEGLPKEEAPKKEVPESDALRSGVPKENPKNRVPTRDLLLTFAMTFLGTVLGTVLAALILSHSPKRIEKEVPYDEAWRLSGRIHLENLEQYQSAVDSLRKALEKDPHNKYLLYYLGYAYYKIRDLKLAIEYNQKALYQDPDLIIAIYNSALYYVDYGEKYKDDTSYRKAIDLYQNVISRDQEFAASAMFNLAALYARLAKQESNKTTKDQYVKKAVELLDRAIEKDVEKGPAQGLERLKKITGEIPVPYGEDLQPIRKDLDFIKMVEKWEYLLTKHSR
jgi:tetratricopeptide (TPR) repeat protein